ncbi:hypothetical protein Dimus_038608 [Dionaea muscipula]
MFTGIIHCRHIIEPYMPNRVMRQFDYVQTIPYDVFMPREVYRGVDSACYRCVHDPMWRLWDSWPDHMMRPGDRGSRHARYRTEASSQYLPWFQRLTHPRVSPADNDDDDDDDDPDATLLPPAARLQRVAGVLHPFHPHRRRQDQRLQHECPYQQAIDTLCEQMKDMIGPSGDDARGGHPGAGSSTRRHGSQRDDQSRGGDYMTTFFCMDYCILFLDDCIYFYLFMTAFIYL